MKKRIFSILLVLTMCLGLLPVQLFAANSEQTVTTPTDFLKYLTDSSVSIIKLGSNITLPRPGKEGTAEGDAAIMIPDGKIIDGNNYTLSFDNGGIILGGDTTFQNISLSFNNFVRNAIIANGYKLTLNNVKNVSSKKSIHLFCGTVDGYNSQGTVPTPGAHGTIILRNGSQVGEIFAGSLQDVPSATSSWDKPSTIEISQSGDYPNTIHACGGTEERGTGNGDSVYGNPTTNPVTGKVTIKFTDPAGKIPKHATVEGAAAANNAADVVVYGGQYSVSPTLNNIKSLDVQAGQVQPTGNFANGVNNNDITIAPSATLNLVNMGEPQVPLSLGALNGGGTLVLGQDQQVVFEGSVTEKTQVAIGSAPPYSQRPTPHHPYITAKHSAQDAFYLFVKPGVQNDVLTRDDNGIWSVGGTGGGATTDQVIMNDLSFGTPEVADDNGYVLIPVTVSFAPNSPEDLALLPYQAREASYSNLVAAKLEGDGYVCTVPTKGGNLRLQFGLFGSGEQPNCLMVEWAGDSSLTIPAGDYELRFVIANKNSANGKPQFPHISFTIPDSTPHQPIQQTITANDVTAVYGDTNQKITASTNGNGTLSYAIKADAATDVVDVDSTTGALTIKKVGTTTVTVTAAKTAQYLEATKDVLVTVNQKDISHEALGPVTNHPYNGQPITPEPGFAQLANMQKDVDFTYSYDNNQYVGQATVRAVGQGNYTGTASTTFTISPLDQSPAITPTATVQSNGKTLDLSNLVKDTKGVVQFQINGGSAAQGAAVAGTTLTSGPTTGEIFLDVNVTAKDVNGDSTPEYKPYAKQQAIKVTVTGKETKPLTVTQSNVVYGTPVNPQVTGAPSGTQVTLSYVGVGETRYGPSAQAPTNVGDYEVTATCETDSILYSGTAHFHINPKDISGASVALGQQLTYNGTEQTQTVAAVTVDGLSATYEVTNNTATDAGNYRLTVTGTNNFIGSQSVDWSIFQATAPAEMQSAHGFVHASAPGSLPLPPLPEGAVLGTVNADNGITNAQVADGSLTYAGAGSVVKNQQYLVTIPVTGAKNYKDYTITVTLVGTEKNVPVGEPTLSANAIVYGQPISTITMTGTMTYGGNSVSGSFQWTQPDATPNAGSYMAQWTFTPSDTALFTEVTGTAAITVSKAMPKGEPSYTRITESGKTLKDANLQSGTITPVGGTIQWQLPESTVVVANTSYTWVYTPQAADQNNYETLTGSVVLYSKSSGGGGGGGGSSRPSDKTETTTTPDGSTVTTVTKADGTVIKTTKHSDGSTVQVVTKKDGTSVTQVTQANGTTATTTVDRDGQVQSEVVLSEQAVAEAKKDSKPVEVPVDAVRPQYNSEGAPQITVKTAGNEKTMISVPVSHPTPGTVAVLVHADGTEEVVRKSVAGEDSVVLPADGSVTLKIVDKSRRFDDVPSNHWATDSILFATSHELYSGTSANTFSPDSSMTRAMLAVVLHNLESNPSTHMGSHFVDVPGDRWYSDAILWAADNHIVSGYADGSFGPEDPITREQLAVMMYHYAGSPMAPDLPLAFSDSGKISDYAEAAIRWAVVNGIMSGNGNGMLDPKGTATRAQTAAILMNFMESSIAPQF